MERETGIEPAPSAWKAEVLPLNYSRAGQTCLGTAPTDGESIGLLLEPSSARWTRSWWREVDSNHRRRKPADLQSASVGRLGIPPKSQQFCRAFVRLSTLLQRNFGPALNPPS